MRTDILYWTWLSTLFRPSSAKFDRILEVFPSPETLFRAGREEIDGLDVDEDDKAIILKKDLSQANAILEYCTKNNVGLLPPDSDHYPLLLRSIPKKPVMLYYKGTLPDFSSNPGIAIVGTRRCTDYGKRNAYTLSYDLARAGAVIVSGLAAGIDAHAHQAAIDAGGKTVAVLGCGIDVVYPTSNRKLFSTIPEFGAVLTDFPPQTPPFSGNFPVRNRIISGISMGTVVVEADLRSGALITARYADKQGRDVFALPGQVGESNSRGTNDLIKNGARVVTRAEDVLDVYARQFPLGLIPSRIGNKVVRGGTGFSKSGGTVPFDPRQVQESKGERESPPSDSVPSGKRGKKREGPENASLLSEKERVVYDMLSSEAALSVDDICSAGLEITEALSVLTMLEVKGFISFDPGGKIKRKS